MNRRSLFQMLFGAAVAPLVPSLPAVALPTARKLVAGDGIALNSMAHPWTDPLKERLAADIYNRAFNNPLVMPAEMTEILREGLNDVFSKAYADDSVNWEGIFASEQECINRVTIQLSDSAMLAANPRMEIDHDT